MNYPKNSNIPEDIYVRFIRSLFNDAIILVIGAICHATIALLVYESTGKPIYLALAGLMLAAGLYRYDGIRRFHAGGGVIEDFAAARHWERQYLIRGTLQGLMLGAFCFVSIYLVPDQYAEVASITVAMGGTITIAGRNYGSKAMVIILAITVVLPISGGFVLKGDLNHVVLGLLIFPFMFIIDKLATHVRTVLFGAISEEKKAARLAQRFDRALNTMSHGLIMLGADGAVVVANAEAAALMGLLSAEKLQGRSLRAIVRRGVAAKLLTVADGRYLEAQLTRALRDSRERKILIRLGDGRHLEFSVSEGRDGLGVITFEDVSQRIEADEKIVTMARFDGLTGLANRAFFHEQVSEQLTIGDQERCCGLAIFDMDDFKSVNDTLGHPIGDGLISDVAKRLSGFAEPGIKVSRFGGDEFVIYFDEVEDEFHLAMLLDRVFASFEGEAEVAGHALTIRMSSGAVLSRVKDSDIDGMIVQADLALYKAKETGKNGWRLFEAAMDAAFRSKQSMKADLRVAVQARALRVVYQPIVSMDTMRIVNCEALCRWDHPDLGPISPAIFIPLAEEIGIISEISSFVLEAACLECAGWPEQVSVSVNLSAKDFRNSEVIDKVTHALAVSGLAPNRLEIEVTETALLDDKSATREYIGQLKLLGVRIALDDFGTGYSSLSYLHKLPLDKVKIDRSFLADLTHNPRSLDILKGVVNLSRPLGLTVTVEGVETFEQLEILAQHVKPDLVQGFLFGAALTSAGIETMSSTVWPFAEQLRSGPRALRG